MPQSHSGGDKPPVTNEPTSNASTIVGDPQHPAEMPPLPEDFGQHDLDLDPSEEHCPDCGAEPGEPCTFYGGRGDGEARGAPHDARWRQVGGGDA